MTDTALEIAIELYNELYVECEHSDMQKHVENSSVKRNNICDKGDDKLN